MKREFILILTILLICLTNSINPISKYLKKGCNTKDGVKCSHSLETNEKKKIPKFNSIYAKKKCFSIGHSYACI